jgi:hypothetical protein
VTQYVSILAEECSNVVVFLFLLQTSKSANHMLTDFKVHIGMFGGIIIAKYGNGNVSWQHVTVCQCCFEPAHWYEGWLRRIHITIILGVNRFPSKHMSSLGFWSHSTLRDAGPKNRVRFSNEATDFSSEQWSDRFWGPLSPLTNKRRWLSSRGVKLITHPLSGA